VACVLCIGYHCPKIDLIFFSDMLSFVIIDLLSYDDVIFFSFFKKSYSCYYFL